MCFDCYVVVLTFTYFGFDWLFAYFIWLLREVLYIASLLLFRFLCVHLCCLMVLSPLTWILNAITWVCLLSCLCLGIWSLAVCGCFTGGLLFWV